MRDVAFPERKTLAGFFPEIELCEPRAESRTLATLDASNRDNPGAVSLVRNSGSIRGDKSYRCFRIGSIAPDVLAYIAENMLPVPHDHISFEIVVRADGTALILAQYSQILGSRWLGIVDASTVPNETVTA